MDFIEKYIHISTPEVYGSCSGLVEEDAPFNPSTPYAASRAACDLHLMTYVKHWKFPVVFTRAANVYGPGQQLYRIIPRVIFCALTGEKLQLHGGGHSVRSFIYGEDVAAGTLLAAQAGKPGEVFHLSTSLNISIADLVRMICRKMNVEFDSLVEVVGERAGKDAAYLLSSAKAQRDLGWKDMVTLEEGVNRTVDWFTSHLESLKTQPQAYIHKP
jgi:dTDP-glucose 4,6-dehydratase